jgi:hypothetical protein
VTTLVFTEKLGVLPDRIFESMFNDRLVAKGTILAVITDIFECYMKLNKGGVDDLVALLVKAKVSDRLLEYFPPGQQTEEAFKEHFEKHGMEKLVRVWTLSCGYMSADRGVMLRRKGFTRAVLEMRKFISKSELTLRIFRRV